MGLKGPSSLPKPPSRDSTSPSASMQSIPPLLDHSIPPVVFWKTQGPPPNLPLHLPVFSTSRGHLSSFDPPPPPCRHARRHARAESCRRLPGAELGAGSASWPGGRVESSRAQRSEAKCWEGRRELLGRTGWGTKQINGLIDVKLIGCLVAWLVGWLVGWVGLVGWLGSWLGSWLGYLGWLGWLGGWLVGWLASGLVGFWHFLAIPVLVGFSNRGAFLFGLF